MDGFEWSNKGPSGLKSQALPGLSNCLRADDLINIGRKCPRLVKAGHHGKRQDLILALHGCLQRGERCLDPWPSSDIHSQAENLRYFEFDKFLIFAA